MKEINFQFQMVLMAHFYETTTPLAELSLEMFLTIQIFKYTLGILSGIPMDAL